MRRAHLAGWLLAFSVVLIGDAHAHLMSPGHGTLNVVEGKAYIIVSLSVSAFSKSEAKEAVSDGVLTAKELTLHQAELKAAVREGLSVRVGPEPVTFSSILLNIPKGPHHTPGRSGELTAMIVAPLGQPDGSVVPIQVRSSLWGGKDKRLKMKATITQGRQTVRSEVYELTPTQPQHRFFKRRLPTTSGQKAAQK